MSAPTCPISRDQALPGMPGRMLPVPPRALDLPSLIAAVNALRDLIGGMFGSGVSTNNKESDKFAPKKGRGSAEQDPGVMVVVRFPWRETFREEVVKRVYSKRDKDVYIDVLRINEMYFTWTYNLWSRPEEQFRWQYYKPSAIASEG